MLLLSCPIIFTASSVRVWFPNPYLNPYGGVGIRGWESGVEKSGLGNWDWKSGIGNPGLGIRGWESVIEGFGDQTPTSIQNVSI
ncbi:MAG: hypothetical protein RIG66_12515 [Coleofasciculus sp. E2-BRE-01]